MKFSENLQALRKARNLSQEQFSEELGVSRQAVSKWESGQSYPEMDKLLIMSKLFSCSLDELVSGKVDAKKVIDKKVYDNFNKKFALAISSGVGIILIGLIVLLVMQTYFPSESSFPTICFMGFILLAVVIFIVYGLKMEIYEKEGKPKYTMDEYYKELSSKFNIAIATGVALIIFAVILILAVEPLFSKHSDIPAAIFLMPVTIGTMIIVYFGIRRSKYESDDDTIKKLKTELEPLMSIQSSSKISDKICSIIMLLATIVYLYLGFIENLWHPGWLVFVFGGILCAIAEIILD